MLLATCGYYAYLKKEVKSNQKHPWCKKSCGQELEKGLDEKEVKSKMGGQGLCSATTDQNKILIITSQAAKHYQVKNVMFCGLTCDY